VKFWALLTYFGTTTPFVKDTLRVFQVANVPLLYVLNLFDKCCYLYLVYRSNYSSLLLRSGARSGAVGWGTALQTGRLRVRFSPRFGPGVDPASNRNEFQVYLLGGWAVKGGWRVGLTTLPATCADCLEIWEPRPSGTLGSCAGSSTRNAATGLYNFQKHSNNF
jgi:hypothetical protein